MGLFNIFNKKRDYSTYVYQLKNLSLLSFAPLTNTFLDYHELQSEQNMKIWDAIFPVVLCGYSAYIDNIIEKPKEYNSLKKSLRNEIIQGDELLDDYVGFINSKNTNSEKLSHLTSFWFSKNFELYLEETLKPKVRDIKFLNIISLFLAFSFDKQKPNFRHYMHETFKSNLKTESGMIEYVKLIELYSYDIFELIKDKQK